MQSESSTVFNNEVPGQGACAGGRRPNPSIFWMLSRERITFGLLWILILTATLLTYIQTRGFDFVNWDDPIHILNNPHFAHRDIRDVAFFWRHPYKDLYIPVSYTVFGLLTLIAHRSASEPLNPHVFHLANLFLHLVNVSLVFQLLRRFTNKNVPAFVGGLVFAVHPLQVESVAWISELRGLLAGSFTLSALHLYLDFSDLKIAEHPARARLIYAASVIMAACAILSKPSAAVIPLLIAATAYWQCGRSWKAALLEASPYVPFALALYPITSRLQPLETQLVPALWLRPLIAADALTFYLSKLVAPFGLAIDYGRNPKWVLSHWWSFAEWIIPATLCFIVYRLRRSKPYLAFGAVFALSALLPVLGLLPFEFQFYSTVADRYTYLPLVGVSIMIAGGLAELRQQQAYVVTWALVTWCIFLGLVSYRQTLVWSSSLALYAQATEVCPFSATMQSLYAGHLYESKDYNQCVEHYLIAIKIDPTYVPFRTTLGKIYANIGDDTDAEVQLRRAIALSPIDAESHSLLGTLLLDNNDAARGVPELQYALLLNPSDCSAGANLGAYYAQHHAYPLAVRVFENSLRYNPTVGPLWRNLGLALYSAGRSNEAVKPLEMAVTLDPSDLAARKILVSILGSSSSGQ